MEKISKKELRDQYMTRTLVGGVYCIKCESNGRTWMKSTKDIAGQKISLSFLSQLILVPSLA